MRPEVDIINKQTSDYWQTPLEFLLCGYGDCEDYAIIKYVSLINLGFDPERLFLTIVEDQFSGKMHMVLSYFVQWGKAPLILDNLSFKILSMDKRVDLKFDKFINTQGVFEIDHNYRLRKLQKSHPKFVALLKRMQKEGFVVKVERKLEVMKPTTFRLSSNAYVYKAPNSAQRLKIWEKGKLFTSYLRQGRWIKITGYFRNRHWKKAKENLWIESNAVEPL